MDEITLTFNEYNKKIIGINPQLELSIEEFTTLDIDYIKNWLLLLTKLEDLLNCNEFCKQEILQTYQRKCAEFCNYISRTRNFNENI
jgi:hypothetical protein